VIAVDDGFRMVCTGGKLEVRASADLVLWRTTDGAILPAGKAAWSIDGNRNWAPEIHRVGDRYVAYYTAANASNVLAIGAASAPAVDGPYTDLGEPLGEHPWGVIDASYFRDVDGRHYMLYKLDGNAHGQPTPIYLHELRPDGLGFLPGATAIELLRNAPATWEGGVIEAPWLVRRDGMYVLFYSGNVYDARYRTGVARSSAIGGPYVRRGDPILHNSARWLGPGHGSVVSIGDEDYFVYHAWNAGPGGQPAPGGRQVLVDRITWQGGWPSIGDGTPGQGLSLWPGD
jgi:arabinan endo-1,5-alpha-L-arabinosidase